MLLSRRTVRGSTLFIALLLAVHGNAQVRRPVSAPSDRGDFGTRFFDDLRSLFGRLQQSDLDRAFERAKAIHCSDLVGQSGEWREVAFLNSDRKLGDWHFDSIEDVKADLTKFVFSGDCPTAQGSVNVATSFPVQETLKRFEQGRIPLSQVVINDNAPVKVTFDLSEDTAVFRLPYLYLDNKPSSTPLYTLAPPLTTSRPVAGLSIEFQCKAVSDADPTYLFLLCYTHLVDRSLPAPRRGERLPPGNSAYYILSDGKEATSSVKLVFGDADRPAPDAAAPRQAAVEDTLWQPVSPKTKLLDVADQEFRLRFNEQSWKGRIDKPQLLAGQAVSDVSGLSTPDRNLQYCVWRPIQASQIPAVLDRNTESALVYSLRLTKNVQSPTTATFEVENDKGQNLSSLQCYFPQSPTPADVTVEQWLSVVGTHIQIQARTQ